MLAHAFLAVATAVEHDHAPAPDGLIRPDPNEFRRLFDAILLDQRPTCTRCCPDRPGGDDIKPQPATATTDGKINNNAHDPRL